MQIAGPISRLVQEISAPVVVCPAIVNYASNELTVGKVLWRDPPSGFASLLRQE